jgi:tetratricopeptide (TPR) repeat protein
VEAVAVIRPLVDASLLKALVAVEGHSLYRLLETPRLYARDHLIEQGRWESVVERHDAHYSDVCRTLRPAFFGRDRVAAQRAIEAELADYHASFGRLLDGGETAGALAMGWALGHVWMFGGRLAEGEGRLTALLEASTGMEGQPRADALTAASWLIQFNQHFEQSIAWADEAIGVYRSIGDEQGLAYVLTRRGHVAFATGDFATAMSALQESLEMCREIGYHEGTAWPLTLLGQARLFSGEESPEVRDMLEEGRRRFIAMDEVYGQVHADMILCCLYGEGREFRLKYAKEMVRLSEQPGADRIMRAAGFFQLANAVWDFDEFDRAEGLNRVSARSSLETAANVNSAISLLQAATFAGHRGDAGRAAMLFGAGDRHFAMHKAPFMERVYQAAIDPAMEALGAERYRELYNLGAQMDVEEATNFLLSR